MDFLPPNFYSIDLFFRGQWGLYANMIGQLISQITAHYILHYHNRLVEKATSDFENRHRLVHADSVFSEDDEVEAKLEKKFDRHRTDTLFRHAFERPHRGDRERLVVRRSVNPVLIAILLCQQLLFLLGCILPSFSIVQNGLVGLLVQAGNGFEAEKTYLSLFTIIKSLFEDAALIHDVIGESKDLIGYSVLSLAFVATVCIAPILLSCVLMYTWFYPMTRKFRMRMSLVIETIQAWQYSEVYLFSVLVTTW